MFRGRTKRRRVLATFTGLLILVVAGIITTAALLARPSTTLPKARLDKIPIYPGAQNVVTGTIQHYWYDSHTITYQTETDIREVMAFYYNKLTYDGWSTNDPQVLLYLNHFGFSYHFTKNETIFLGFVFPRLKTQSAKDPWFQIDQVETTTELSVHTNIAFYIDRKLTEVTLDEHTWLRSR